MLLNQHCRCFTSYLKYNLLFKKRRVQDLNLRAGITGSPDFESGALPLCQLSITGIIVPANIPHCKLILVIFVHVSDDEIHRERYDCKA